MSVLVIGAHPDDETLGCGGTLLKHGTRGDELSWLIVTRAHEPRWSKEAVSAKATEIERVAQALGVNQLRHLEFPAMLLDTVPLSDIIDSIRDFVREVSPETVYVVHGGDVHTDHRIVYDATMSVIKPFYMEGLGIRRVLCYETPSSTDAAPAVTASPFVPNVYSDISSFLERKIEMVELYQSEVQLELLPRGASAVRAWARTRGATVGVQYAEALMLVRELL